MASKTMYFSRSSSGYNAEDGDYIDYTPDASISFGSGYKATYFYFEVDGGLTSATTSARTHGANLQVKSNGTWYEIWDGDLYLPKKSTTGYAISFEGSIPSSYQSTIGTYGITDLRLQQQESSAGNNFALRGTSGEGTLEVEYTVPSPTVTTPSISSITQNNDGTYTIKWGACTGSNGSGSVTYGVYDDTAGRYLSQSVSGTSYTGTIPAYGTTRQYSVIAYYSGTSSGWSSIVSKTFYTPSITAPSDLKVTTATAQTCALSWTAAKLNYTSGTITYSIRRNGTQVTTTTSTSYTIPESTTKGWGTSASTMTVVAVGSSLGNTASGTTLTSSATSGVTYTYKAAVTTQPSNLKINSGTSYTGSTAPLTWSAAVFSGGQTPTYSIRVDDTQIDTTTSTSYTIPETITKLYTSTKTITIVATGGGTTSNASNSVTYTYQPTITAPSNLQINGASSYIGETAPLSWTAATLSNGETVTYSIRKNGTQFTTTTSTSYTVPSTTTSTWETSAVTLTVVATGSGVTSVASNEVTYTYKPPYKTIKYHDGTSWIECIVYYHNGTKWIKCDTYYHTGSTWSLSNH